MSNGASSHGINPISSCDPVSWLLIGRDRGWEETIQDQEPEPGCCPLPSHLYSPALPRCLHLQAPAGHSPPIQREFSLSGQPRRGGVNRDEREHRPRQGSPRWCSHSRWVSWRTGGGTWNPPVSGTTFRGTDPPGSRGERGRLQGQGSDAQGCCGVPAGQGDLPPTPLTQVMGFLPSLHDLGEILRGHALAGVQASGQVSQAGHQLVQGRAWQWASHV